MNAKPLQTTLVTIMNKWPWGFLIKLTLDLMVFAVSLPLAALVVSATIPSIQLNYFEIVLIGAIITRSLLFNLFRLHSSIWRFTSIGDLIRLIEASTLSSLVILGVGLLFPKYSLPPSVMVIDWLLVVFLTGGVRLTLRRLYELYLEPNKSGRQKIRALVYGAGRAGEALLRSIKNTPSMGITIVGLIDDDPMKKGRRIHGKPVLGQGENVRSIVEKYRVNVIYFAISALSGEETRRLMELVNKQVGNRVTIKIVPGLKDLMEGRVTINELRHVEIRDLLRRPPIDLDNSGVERMINHRRVLVAGAGGSIGSELCKQIASYEPLELIAVDHSEFLLYKVKQELEDRYPNLRVAGRVINVCDEEMMERVFEEHKPDIIFHAAAYKHVPLMEENPWSAVRNNLQSTLVLTKLARIHQVERFVLISTDKAVEPRNVMGATKRLCEKIVLNSVLNGPTKFMAVRFGNVLGSSGSVIPRFKDQILRRGPITVTHPEVSRYFMLIPEAVELVIHAGAIGDTGNIYVLDMGDPVRIVDLARYMIRLSGLEEGKDIDIKFVGLRPGEKLHERLYLEGEEKETSIPNVMMLRPDFKFSPEFEIQVGEFIADVPHLEREELLSTLQSFVTDAKLDELVAEIRA
jgi:FlaA1/EpsC-like NDP-sugar epimerase